MPRKTDTTTLAPRMVPKYIKGKSVVEAEVKIGRKVINVNDLDDNKYREALFYGIAIMIEQGKL